MVQRHFALNAAALSASTTELLTQRRLQNAPLLAPGLTFSCGSAGETLVPWFCLLTVARLSLRLAQWTSFHFQTFSCEALLSAWHDNSL